MTALRPMILTALATAAAGWPLGAPAQERVASRAGAAVMITAHLKDMDSGAALEGAVIELSGVARRHVTGSDGTVSFEAERGSYTLTIRRAGYVTIDGDFDVIRNGDFTLSMRRETEEDRQGEPLMVPARMIVKAVDAQRGQPVEGATVSLSGGRVAPVDAPAPVPLRAVTNADGYAEFRDLTADFAHVTVEMIGYATRTEPVSLHPDRTTSVEVDLTVEAVALRPIRVEVRSRFLEQQGFYRRLEQGVVMRLLTRQSILDRGSPRISDAFAHVPGVQIDRPGDYRAELRARDCQLAVFVDGQEWSADIEGSVNIDQIPPDWVEVAEVYWGLRTPPRFRGQTNGGCGAAVIWTRRAVGKG